MQNCSESEYRRNYGLGIYMPLAIVSGTTPAINWVHSHHNAKPILLTNAAGTVVAYTCHAILGFPGQFANAVGLAGAQYYYNRYRDYNDVTGRYIQADPIGLAGDANPYAYAMGNTLRYTDPDGLQRVPRAAPVPRLPYRPANAFDAQIDALNARGREIKPGYQGLQRVGNGSTAQDVITATTMFARVQSAWAATNRVCLGSGQPGAGYRQPASNGGRTPIELPGLSYSPTVRNRALEDPRFHNFPYSFDGAILSGQLSLRPNGYRMYSSSGSANGMLGNFEVGINRAGAIDHRVFKPNR